MKRSVPATPLPLDMTVGAALEPAHARDLESPPEQRTGA